MPQPANLPFPLGKGYHQALLDDKYYDRSQSDFVGSPCMGIEGMVVTMKSPYKTVHTAASAVATVSAARDPQQFGLQDTTWICVRNSTAQSGGANMLLPKRAVRWENGFEGKRVDGYAFRAANTGPEPIAGIVDPFLPSGGVNPGDLFWLQVGGPSICTMTAEAADASAKLVQGDRLVAATGANSTGAATTGCTTEGRLEKQVPFAMTSQQATFSELAAELQNVVGIAMSSCTSQQSTNADFLVKLNLDRNW